MELIFCGIEPLSLVDLDGKLACTIFTHGCNFRCPFCHHKNLALSKDIQEIPFNEILDFLKLRKNMLDTVVITGGEPTIYPDLDNKLQKIKELGYYIKLDTNGTNPEAIKRLYEKGLIDYVAMDIKNTLPKYALTCGNPHVNLLNIQKSIIFLKTSGIEYEFRTTIIHEYHKLEDFKAIGEWIKDCPRYFLQKFVNSETCINQNLHEVSINNAVIFKNELLKYFPKVELRGY